MIDKLTSAPSADAAASTPASRASTQSAVTPQAAAPAANTRLYVEQDGERYVYRLVDVATGRLLLEVPREQADQLKGFAAEAGAPLVSTSA